MESTFPYHWGLKDELPALRDVQRIDFALLEDKESSKLQIEEKIYERRVAEAERQALDLRNRFRAWEENHKHLREQPALLKKFSDTSLQKQAQTKATKSQKNLLKSQKLEEKFKPKILEHQSAVLAKQKWHQEILEDLRQKHEFALKQKVDERIKMANLKKTYFELENMRLERLKRQKDAQKRAFELKQANCARIGTEILKRQYAKEHYWTNLVSQFVKERIQGRDLDNKTSESKAKLQQRSEFRRANGLERIFGNSENTRPNPGRTKNDTDSIALLKRHYFPLPYRISNVF